MLCSKRYFLTKSWIPLFWSECLLLLADPTRLLPLLTHQVHQQRLLHGLVWPRMFLISQPILLRPHLTHLICLPFLLSLLLCRQRLPLCIHTSHLLNHFIAHLCLQLEHNHHLLWPQPQAHQNLLRPVWPKSMRANAWVLPSFFP